MKLLTSELFILRSVMSADTNALHRCNEKVENFEGPEKELLAEDSPIRDCLLAETLSGKQG
jgi:hypothetical protein